MVTFTRAQLPADFGDPSTGLLFQIGDESLVSFGYKQGVCLLFDTTKNIPMDGKLYLVDDGRQMIARKVFQRGDKFLLIAGNPSYPQQEVSNIKVIGRAVSFHGNIE